MAPTSSNTNALTQGASPNLANKTNLTKLSGSRRSGHLLSNARATKPSENPASRVLRSDNNLNRFRNRDRIVKSGKTHISLNSNDSSPSIAGRDDLSERPQRSDDNVVSRVRRFSSSSTTSRSMGSEKHRRLSNSSGSISPKQTGKAKKWVLGASRRQLKPNAVEVWVNRMSWIMEHSEPKMLASEFLQTFPGDWTTKGQEELASLLQEYSRGILSKETLGKGPEVARVCRFRWNMCLFVDHLVKSLDLPKPDNKICCRWDSESWRKEVMSKHGEDYFQYLEKNAWSTLVSGRVLEWSWSSSKQGPPFFRPIQYLVAAMIQADMSAKQMRLTVKELEKIVEQYWIRDSTLDLDLVYEDGKICPRRTIVFPKRRSPRR